MSQQLNTLPPWSTATLEAYSTCPYRYYRTQVKKDFKPDENPATVISKELHVAFANAISDTAPLPERFKRFTPLIEHLKNVPGKKRVCHGLAVDKSLKPCSFDKAWARTTVDYIVAHKSSAVLASFRTGAFEPSDAMRLAAALYFLNHLECETLHVRTFWLRSGKVEKESFSRKDLKTLLQTFVPLYTRWKSSHETGTWDAKPSGLCSKHCGLKDCKFCL